MSEIEKIRKLDILKFIQVLNFFALKNGGSINKLKAMELIFFADRYHLRKYGRPVAWSRYFALQHGPVSSEMLDITNDKVASDDKELINKYIKVIDKSNYKSIVNEIDEDKFSKTDIEALNFSWNTFGQFNHWELRNITHAYPEWKGYENTGRFQMNWFKFFEDPLPDDPNLKLISKDPFKEIKSDLAKISLEEHLRIRNMIDKLWRISCYCK